MPRFEVCGQIQGKERQQKRFYLAVNDSAAQLMAINDGMIVSSITRLPDEPPTEPQLSYARDLGIIAPKNATKDEVSDLISRRVQKDKPASDTHKGFAIKYGVQFTQFIGKKDLFDRIMHTLKVPGREKELISWFIYRVYRELVRGQDDAPIEGPENPLIQKIALELVNDVSVVKSVRRYDGREIIWFGQWTSPEGAVYQGGSNRTIAYKQAVSTLLQHLEPGPKIEVSKTLSHVKSSQQKEIPSPGRAISKKSSGCLSFILLGLIGVALISVCIVWIINHAA